MQHFRSGFRLITGTEKQYRGGWSTEQRRIALRCEPYWECETINIITSRSWCIGLQRSWGAMLLYQGFLDCIRFTCCWIFEWNIVGLVQGNGAKAAIDPTQEMRQKNRKAYYFKQDHSATCLNLLFLWQLNFTYQAC